LFLSRRKPGFRIISPVHGINPILLSGLEGGLTFFQLLLQLGDA
jgi:hypothetical protein